MVIPTHNRPHSLQDAVASAQEQTVPPLEIIVVDDGSDPPVDPTIFSDSTIPIRVIRNAESLGAAAARNVGATCAIGDFIAFLDDDDSWAPWKLEAMAACHSAYPQADVIFHQTGYVASPPSGRCQCTILEQPLLRMLRQQPPSLDGVVVRRTLHLESPLDESFVGAEDLEYLIRLAKQSTAMVETRATLAVLGEAEVSAIGIDKRIQGRLELLKRHSEILDDTQATAFFWMRLGHQYRRNGQRVAALRSFGRSFVARPNISAAKGTFLSLLPKRLQERRTR